MLKFAPLLAIACLALATGTKLPQKEETKTPKAEPCCVPDQVEGVFGMTIGYYTEGDENADASDHLVFYNYDAVNERVAYTVSDDVIAQNPPHTKYILNWEEQRQYVINLADDTCTVSDMTNPFTRTCIPANSTKMSNARYGAGESSLDVNIWLYESKDADGYGVESYFTGTKTSCCPIGQGIKFTSATDARVMGVGYLQTTVGIVDESVFDPPASCTVEKEGKQPYQDSHFYKFIQNQHQVKTKPLGAKPIHPKKAKNICCIAEVYEGTGAMIEGVDSKDPSFVAGLWILARFSYDAPNQRMASALDVTWDSSGGGGLYRSIYDWNSNRAYIIDETNNTCTYTEMTTEFERVCVPDDAKSLGRSYVGSVNETLPYESYSVNVDEDPDNSFSVLVSVTDQCQLINDRIMGTVNGVRVVLMIEFFNETNTISDPGVYDPPANCVPATKISPPSPLTYLEMKHGIKTRVPKEMESRKENEV